MGIWKGLWGKKINLKIETIYEKNTLTNNASGEIDKYELVVEVIVMVNSSKQKLKFKESFRKYSSKAYCWSRFYRIENWRPFET